MPAINAVYFNGGSSTEFTVAVPQGVARVETPFQELNRNALVVTQRYMQKRSAYVQPAQNATMPASVAANITFTGTAYFVGDGPREPVGIDDVITFERTWATVPANFVETQSPIKVTVTKPNQWTLKICNTRFSQTAAPGYYIVSRLTNMGLSVAGVTSSFNAYVQRDFFLIGTGGNYANTSLIPARNETVKTYRDWSSFPVNVEMPSATWIQMEAALPQQNAKLLSGFQSLGNDIFGGPSATTNNTVCGTYTGPALSAGTYIYGDSELTRYIGNIWERRSVNVTIT